MEEWSSRIVVMLGGGGRSGAAPAFTINVDAPLLVELVPGS